MNKQNIKSFSALALAALFLSTTVTASFADSGASEQIPAGTEVATLDHSFHSASSSNNIREFHYDNGANSTPTSGIEKMPIRGAALTSNLPIAGTILYHAGGPVLTSVNIYTIWYGASATYGNSCAQTPTGDSAVLTPFLRNIGTSPWYSTNTRYFSRTGSTNNFVTNNVNNPVNNCAFVNSSTYGNSLEGAAASVTTSAAAVLGATTLTVSSTTGAYVGLPITGTGIAAGTVISAVNTGTKVLTLSLATTKAIATKAKLSITAPTTQFIVDTLLKANIFPTDSSALYFVFTDPSVTVNGFGTSFCGYHGYFKPSNGLATSVQYSFVGNPGTTYIGGCAAQSASSPNGNVQADAMVSVTAHELVETVSDPLLNAWFDSAGNENGDKCAWVFGTTTSTAPYSNTTVGGAAYLVQQNWDPVLGGCYSAAAPLPTFSASVSVANVYLETSTAASVTPIKAIGGTGAYTYSITPALPAGLTFDSGTGTITGTPTVKLLTPLVETVSVTDGVSTPFSGNFNLNINGGITVALSTTAPKFTRGTPATINLIQSATGGYPNFVYSLSPSVSGVTINSSTGALTFTSSTVAVNAKKLTLTVTDAQKFTKTFSVTLTIA